MADDVDDASIRTTAFSDLFKKLPSLGTDSWLNRHSQRTRIASEKKDEYIKKVGDGKFCCKGKSSSFISFGGMLIM